MESITWYRPCARRYALAGSLLCIVSLIWGAIELARAAHTMLFAALCPLLPGGLLLMVAFIEHRGTVTLTEDSLIIRYPVPDASRDLRRRLREGLPYHEILSLTTESYRGDSLIVRDSTLCRFRVRNGKHFSVYFYHFGKKAEWEIISELQRRISR